MKITAIGRMAAIRTSINKDILVRLRTLPGVKKWRGALLLFEPTREAINFVKSNFPAAEWDEDAQRFITIVESIEKSAIHRPPEVPRDFVFKTVPYQHQHDLFMASRDKAYYAFLMDQGTGKTKVILDSAAYLWAQGKIQGLLVIAYPNGVHLNWTSVEIPAHIPDWCRYIAVGWEAKKGTKALKPIYDAPVSDENALRILTINVEALSTKRGEEVCRNFLMSFPSMMVIDESSSIRKMATKRTKSIIKLGLFAPYRRILTGTVAPNGPLNLYSQYLFLDEGILGFSSFYSYRARYAVMRPLPGKYARSGRKIEIVVGYQHTEELQDKIKPFSYRVMKADCLDLPDKVYQNLTVELTDRQQELYDQFVEEAVAEFRGREIPAILAITRLLRCHQVVCGFMPPPIGTDPDEAMGEPIDPVNPRLTLLQDHIDTILPYDTDLKQFESDVDKMVIWAHYRYNIKEILDMLTEKYGSGVALPYSGKTPVGMRPEIVKAFQNPHSKVRFLVANKAGAFGLTLTAGRYSTYYSNYFDLEVRLQSEDRLHRIGQRNQVLYTDIEAPGTVDSTIIKKLRGKYEVQANILGDELVDWLSGEGVMGKEVVNQGGLLI